ncbi:PadR family transcriptional regulator [Lapillicoccus jejuensis]|uniref:PadR family transcriptional regulator n=1 Tax=Lapillicoccus jejuensis TaxID=402171 RepID=A0A542E0A3_9MICO|nr:helix-turn-helix transcriptional regulator [Lapillicoccus jejuensis]TQJ08709.1 PadR family transcriptional regulator [Lapillicoccus jejuensis]
MATDPRMTATTVDVLRTFLTDPQQELYGLQVMSETGLPSGTVFPILARFEARGWLESGWEQVDPSEVRRPARRYYRLTPDGLESTRLAIARVTAERRARTGVLRPADGLAGGAS